MITFENKSFWIESCGSRVMNTPSMVGWKVSCKLWKEKMFGDRLIAADNFANDTVRKHPMASRALAQPVSATSWSKKGWLSVIGRRRSGEPDS